MTEMTRKKNLLNLLLSGWTYTIRAAAPLRIMMMSGRAAETMGADGFDNIVWASSEDGEDDFAGMTIVPGTYGTLIVEANGDYR